MKLPNSNLLLVESEKVAGYLLNLRHFHGASKARFFLKFGFRVENPQQLATALLEHGLRYEVILTRNTPFGPRYEVEGSLNTPDGRAPLVRTIWQLDKGELAPRLITAYPAEP